MNTIPKCRTASLPLSLTLVWMLPHSATAQEYSLRNLGQTGADSFLVEGISDDGTVVAGNYRKGAETTGFGWTATAGRTDLQNTVAKYVSTQNVSGDGTLFVGQSKFGGTYSATYQTLTGAPTVLPNSRAFLFPTGGGSAFDASSDGSVIVGYSQGQVGVGDPQATHAMRWVKNGGGSYDAQDLGDFAGGNDYSIANGVSRDGSVVVGNGDLNGDTVAFRWTAGTGLVSLGDLAGGVTSSLAEAVSDDGSVVVGYGTDASNARRAMRWTQADGMIGLPNVDPTQIFSLAHDVSGDGSVIVGVATITANARAEKAFRWTQETGSKTLDSLLSAEGVDLTNTELLAAKAISQDGKIIAGNARVDFGMGPEDTGFVAVYDVTVNETKSGVIFPSDFTQSAGSISGASQFAGNALDIASDGLMFQGLKAPMNTGNGLSFVQQPSRLGGFVFGQGQQLLSSAKDRATTGSGGAAVTWAMPNGVMVGGGPLALRHSFTSSALGSTAGITGLGAGAFVRYAPAPTGLQAMVTATTLSLTADINRNYLNGGATETAAGRTNGRFSGVKARLGYGMGLTQSSTLTPFAALSWGRSEFDGYTETGPLFKGTVSSQSTNRNRLEMGAEIRHKASSRLELSGALSISRTNEQSTFAQLTVPVLANTTFGGGAGNRAYTSLKAEVGMSYAVSENVSFNSGLAVNKGLGGMSDLDDATLTLGMNFSF